MESYKALEGIQQQLVEVDSYIQQLVGAELERGPAGDMLDAVLASEGKKLRPILLLLAGNTGPAAKANADRLCKLAAILEVVHIASLIHDDIVDDSPLRRGNPTIQARFGKDMAVYTGDFLLSRIMQQLFQQDMGESGLILSKTIEKMCRGEMNQFSCRYDTATTIDSYLENISGKTVELFVSACKIGAIEGGCGKKRVRNLARFGEHLGYMFQMRDDLLDFISNEVVEGKPVHKDFIEGIYTLPVLYTFSNEEYGPRLKEIAREVRQEGADKQQLEEICRCVALSGGIEFTQKQIRNHASQAKKILLTLQGSPISQTLWSMLSWLTDLEKLYTKHAS